MGGKLRLIAVVAALTAVTGLPAGSSAASHRAAGNHTLNAAFPTWSPDGKQLAFAYVLSPRRYRIVRTSSKPGGVLHTVRATWGYCCGGLQWTRGGQFLFQTGVGLRIVPAQGGKSKRFYFPGCPNPDGCQVGGFFLSPAQKYAATRLTSDGSVPDARWAIGLMKLDPGRQPAVLTSPLGAEENAASILDIPLAFSPDNAQLVFSRASWDGYGYGTGPPALRAISLAGGGSVPVAQSGIPGASLIPSDASQMQWSPDGRWVAYVEWGRYSQNFMVVPTSGAEAPRQLATCTDYYSHFSWSPTSKLLAYECGSYHSQPAQFMTVAPDGAQRTDLLQGHRALRYVQDFYSSPQWSPDGSHLAFDAYGNGFVYVWTIRPDGRGLAARS